MIVTIKGNPRVTTVPDSRKISRADATDLVLEAGLSRSPVALAIKAVRREGPPFTYTKDGAVYDEETLLEWINAEKAKLKAKRGY
jgi:hypothetical protein